MTDRTAEAFLVIAFEQFPLPPFLSLMLLRYEAGWMDVREMPSRMNVLWSASLGAADACVKCPQMKSMIESATKTMIRQWERQQQRPRQRVGLQDQNHQ